MPASLLKIKCRMIRRVLAKFLSIALLLCCFISCHTTAKPLSRVAPTIILCHGLGGKPDHMSSIKSYLKDAFPSSLIIAPYEKNSHNKSITEQASDLVDNPVDENDNPYHLPNKSPLVLIGHSQGGLRAYEAAQEFSAKGYNVLAVITIASPWEGVPVLKKQNNDALEQLFNKQPWKRILKSHWAQDSDPHNADTEQAQTLDIRPRTIFLSLLGELKNSIKNKMSSLGTSQSLAGKEDMNPQKSVFLPKVHRQLAKNTLPILAIGGSLSPALKRELKERFALEEDFWSELGNILGGKEHDLLIPLQSQLAHNTPNIPFFTRYSIKGVVHSSEDMFGNTRELTSLEIMDQIKQFIADKMK